MSEKPHSCIQELAKNANLLEIPPKRGITFPEHQFSVENHGDQHLTIIILEQNELEELLSEQGGGDGT